MRLRLLHVLIFAVTLSFALRAGDVWQGLDWLLQVKRATAGNPDPAAQAAETQDATRAGASGSETPAAGDLRTAALPSDILELTDEEIDILQQLARRRDEIERQERDLDRRRTLLEAAERRIDEKVTELETLKQSIESLMIQHDEQAESQLASLVKIYENMKPKNAARIFEELDMFVLLDVIERMKERKVAPILAKLNPRRAKAITLKLAQRRELPEAAP